MLTFLFDKHTTSESIYALTERIKEFAENLKLSETNLSKLRSTFRGIFSVIHIVYSAISALVTGFKNLISAFSPVVSGFLSVSSTVGSAIEKVDSFITSTNLFNKIVVDALSPVVIVFETLRYIVEDMAGAFNEAGGGIAGAASAIKTAWDDVLKIITAVIKTLTGIDISGLFGGFSVNLSGLLGSNSSSEAEKATKNVQSYMSAFVDFKRYGGGVIGTVAALNDVWGIFTESVRSAGGGVKGVLSTIGGVFKSLATVIGLLISTIINFVSRLTGVGVPAILSKIQSAVNSLGGAVSTLFSGIGALFSSLTSGLHPLQAIRDVFAKIGEALSAIKITLGGSSAKLSFSGLFDTSFVDWLKTGGDILQTIVKLVVELTGTVGGGLLKALRAVVNVFPSNSKYGFSEFFDTLLSGAMIYGIIKFVRSLHKTVEAVDTVKNSIAGMFGSIGKTFNSITGYVQQLTNKAKINNFKNVAMSIAILAGSVLVLALALKSLSKVDWDEMKVGMVGFLEIMVLLVAAVIAINKLGGISVTKFDSKGEYITQMLGIVKMVASMLVLSSAVKSMATALATLSTLDFKSMQVAMLGLAELMTMIGIFAKLTGGTNTLGLLGLLPVILMVKVIIKHLQELSAVDPSSITSGVKIMAIVFGAITASLTIIAAVSKGSRNVSGFGTGLGLIAAAGSLFVIAKALERFAELDTSAMQDSANIMAKMLLGITALMAVLSLMGRSTVQKYDGGGLSFLSMFQGGSMMDVGGGMLLTAASLVVLAKALKTLMDVVTNSTGKEMLEALGVFAICMGSIAAVAKILSPLTGSLSKMGLALLSIGAGLVLISAGSPLIANAMNTLTQYAPLIVESLMTFLIELLDGIAADMPRLVAAVMNFLGALFGSVIEELKKLDTGDLENLLLGLGVLTTALIGFKYLKSLVPGAMASVAEVGLFVIEVVAVTALIIAAIGALVAGFGALAEIPYAQELVEKGVELLTTIGEAIGGFVGGIVGGLIGGMTEGITSALPQIASDLSNFMENLGPFIEGMDSDGSLLSKLSGFSETMNQFSISDPDNVEALGKVLPKFGTNLSKFATNIGNVENWDDVKNSASAFASFAEGLAVIPTDISVFNNLSTFGEKLPAFGKNFKSYAESIASESASWDDVKLSAEALVAFATASGTIPNDGGLISWFTGDNDIGAFGENLKTFGPSFADYAKATKNVAWTGVKKSAEALADFAKATEIIPNEDGLISWFTGDNTMGTFGTQLDIFRPKWVAFANDTAGVSSWTGITDSGEALRLFAQAAGDIPNDGGGITLFTGDNTIGTFGTQIDIFRPKWVAFANDTAGVSSWDGVTDSGEALNSFARNVSIACNALPSKKKLSTFTENLGTCISDLSDAASDLTGLNSTFSSIEFSSVESILGTLEKAVTSFDSAAGLDLNAVFVQIGESASSSFAFGLAQNEGAIIISSQNIMIDCVEMVRSFLPAFGSAGEYLISGFVYGIQNGEASAVDAAGALAEAVDQKIREVLIVNSPSRKGIEIGMFVDLGLATGISDYQGTVVNAASTMAQSIETAVRDATQVHSLSPLYFGIGRWVSASTAAGITSEQFATASAALDFGEETGTHVSTGLLNAMPAVYSSGKQVGEAATEGIADGLEEEAGSWFSKMMNGLARGVDSTFGGSYVSDGLSRFTDSANDSILSIVEAVANGGDVEEGVESLMDVIDLGITDNADTVTSAASAVGSSAISAIESEVKLSRGELGEYIVEGIADGISSDMSAEEAATQKAQNIISAFQEVLDKMDIQSEIADLELELWQAMNPDATVSEQETMQLNRYYDAIYGSNGKIEAATAAYAEYLAVAHELGEEDQTTLEYKQKYLQAVLDVNDAISTYNDYAAEEIENNKTAQESYDELLASWKTADSLTIRNSAGVITEVLRGQDEIQARWEYLEELARNATGYDPDAITELDQIDAATVLSEIVNAATNVYEQNADTIIASVLAASSAYVSETAGATSSMVNAMSAGSTVSGAAIGTTMANAISSGIQNGGSTVTSTVDSLLTSCTTTMNDDYSDWVQVGGYLVDGFIAGIRAKQAEAAAAAAAMAAAARSAASVEISVNSPSKDFADIGMYADLGMAQGLEDYTDTVTTASAAMAKSGLDGVTKVVSQINAMMDDEGAYAPTIAPVVDLTDVNRSARVIGGMFQDETLDVSANVRSAQYTGYLHDSTVNETNGNAVSGGNSYTFNQNNYSPKSLSRIEIYRQTKNLFSTLKGVNT